RAGCTPQTYLYCAKSTRNLCTAVGNSSNSRPARRDSWGERQHAQMLISAREHGSDTLKLFLREEDTE
ncbi:MAG: hypothetical protein ACPIOQ_33205, partial [Promethearchaeia archaeon]